MSPDKRELTDIKSNADPHGRVERETKAIGLNADLERRRNKMTTLKADKARLAEELAELEAESSGYVHAVSEQDVLNHQKAIDETSRKMADIKGRIEEQEGYLRKAASGNTNTTAPLIREQEEILADLALGGGKYEESDLTRIEEAIKKASESDQKNAAKTQALIRHVQPTIAGLRRHLADVEREANSLADLAPKIVDQFLMSEAEKVGAEYAALAEKLVSTFKRLAVLEKILIHLGVQKDSGGRQPQSIFSPHCFDEMLLPTFRLKAGEKLHAQDGSRGVFFSAGLTGWSGERVAQEVEAEKARLEKRGVL